MHASSAVSYTFFKYFRSIMKKMSAGPQIMLSVPKRWSIMKKTSTGPQVMSSLQKGIKFIFSLKLWKCVYPDGSESRPCEREKTSLTPHTLVPYFSCFFSSSSRGFQNSVVTTRKTLVPYKEEKKEIDKLNFYLATIGGPWYFW